MKTNEYRTFFSTFMLQRNSANVWVAHGTLCNDPKVYHTSTINMWNSGIATTAENRDCEFRPRQFQSISAEPLTATRGFLRFRRILVEKHRCGRMLWSLRMDNLYCTCWKV